MPSCVSIINIPLKYSESPDQPLPKPIDTSTCSVLTWVDPCSALQVSESPFLRSFAWVRSRHHPRRETPSMQGGMAEGYRLSMAKLQMVGCVYILWFLPDLFSPDSHSDLTSRNDWKAYGIVAQYRNITCRTDLERKLLLQIPKPLQERKGNKGQGNIELSG